jgi:hypothetical protein
MKDVGIRAWYACAGVLLGMILDYALTHKVELGWRETAEGAAQTARECHVELDRCMFLLRGHAPLEAPK